MIEKPLDWLLDHTDYWGKLGRKTKHDQAKLDRAKKLFSALGNPEKDFNIIHIVGTKGKGSVAAMAASIIAGAGIKTGCYTSPHVEEITERIAINGEYISESVLEKLITEIRPVVEKSEEPYTFFELFTAVALLYFQREKVGLAVLEAGMGGEFSATNACDPIAVVITNIGFEHADALGPTFADIANHKVGAIRPGVPVFTTAVESSGLHEVRKRCAEVNTPLTEIDFSSFTLPEKTNLKGKHQRINAALATAVAENILPALGKKPDRRHIVDALESISLPARIEIISEKPLIIIDGAHTPESMADLAGAIKEFSYRDLVLVISMKEDKSIEDTLRPILPLIDYLITTRYDYPGFADIGTIEHAALVARDRCKDFELHSADKVEDALELALRGARPDDAIVVAGSFYLAGQARSWFKKELGKKVE
ncbi:MAG: bifunctional folylpolyglutamate synthase/dihydrofolate synthase [Planctomycetota bacterium]|nr:MAG: bifunctional folylpolyglutamate synthase/dihydrofolate synthase [Planctomycetota bacterium]